MLSTLGLVVAGTIMKEHRNTHAKIIEIYDTFEKKCR